LTIRNYSNRAIFKKLNDLDENLKKTDIENKIAIKLSIVAFMLALFAIGYPIYLSLFNIDTVTKSIISLILVVPPFLVIIWQAIELSILVKEYKRK
jgi:flagellar biosynthesis protein FliP